MLFAALRQRDTPIANLARLLACWLVVILLAQGLSALQTLVRGPAHRHLPVAQGIVAVAEVRLPDHHRAHALAHESGQAHHHAADVVAVPADSEAGLDAAACVLMAALAPLAVNYAWPARHMRAAPVATEAWALTEHDSPAPRRPPRG